MKKFKKAWGKGGKGVEHLVKAAGKTITGETLNKAEKDTVRGFRTGARQLLDDEEDQQSLEQVQAAIVKSERQQSEEASKRAAQAKVQGEERQIQQAIEQSQSEQEQINPWLAEEEERLTAFKLAHQRKEAVERKEAEELKKALLQVERLKAAEMAQQEKQAAQAKFQEQQRLMELLQKTMLEAKEGLQKAQKVAEEKAAQAVAAEAALHTYGAEGSAVHSSHEPDYYEGTKLAGAGESEQ